MKSEINQKKHLPIPNNNQEELLKSLRKEQKQFISRLLSFKGRLHLPYILDLLLPLIESLDYNALEWKYRTSASSCR